MSATGSFATVTSDRWCSRAVDAGYDTGAGWLASGAKRLGPCPLIGQTPMAEAGRRKRRLVLGRQYLEMARRLVGYRTDRAPHPRRLRSYQETVDAEASGGGTSSGGERKFAMLNWVAAPRDSKGFEPHNRLLAALSGSDLQSLQPHIEAVPLARGSVLFEVGEPLTRVCFVESGVVSLLTAFYNRVTVGVGPVGREGAVGVGSLLLGGDTALGRYQVLVPGSALTMEVPAFRRALGQRPKLRMACEACQSALGPVAPGRSLHQAAHGGAAVCALAADVRRPDGGRYVRAYAGMPR